MARIGQLPAELLMFTDDCDMVRARAGKVSVIGVCACHSYSERIWKTCDARAIRLMNALSHHCARIHA